MKKNRGSILRVTVLLVLVASFVLIHGGAAYSLYENDGVDESYRDYTGWFEGAVANSDLSVRDRVEFYKKRIKDQENSLSFTYGHVLAYGSLRDDDAFLCSSFGDEMSSHCKKYWPRLTHYKQMALGQCADIKTEPEKKALFMEVCENLNNCENISDERLRNLCISLTKGDAALLREVMESYAERYEAPHKMREILGVFQGYYQGGSQEACEIYSSLQRAGYAFMCPLLFNSAANVDEILNVILDDLAYYYMAVVEGDITHCDVIKNNAVHEGCLSSDPKKFFDPPYKKPVE